MRIIKVETDHHHQIPRAQWAIIQVSQCTSLSSLFGTDFSKKGVSITIRLLPLLCLLSAPSNGHVHLSLCQCIPRHKHTRSLKDWKLLLPREAIAERSQNHINHIALFNALPQVSHVTIEPLMIRSPNHASHSHVVVHPPVISQLVFVSVFLAVTPP